MESFPMKHLKKLSFHLGARGKLLAGFFILLGMLLVSGLLAVYELKDLMREMNGMLCDGYRSVTYGQTMSSNLEKTQALFLHLQLPPQAPNESSAQRFAKLDSTFSRALEQASKNLTYAGEAEQVAQIEIFAEGYYALMRSYFRGDTLSLESYALHGMPLYDSINRHIDSLLALNDHAVSSFADALLTRPERAIRPGMIIFSVGLLFALLYIYLVEVFYFRPLRRLRESVEHYFNTGRWRYKAQPANDEIVALHGAVEHVIRRSELLEAERKRP